MQSISGQLQQQCASDWTAVTEHAFCQELAQGILPKEKMAEYLIQDYAFVDGFVRLAASAIAHAPTLADSIPLSQFLAVITGPENTYFHRSFEALDVTESQWQNASLWQVTQDFQSLMQRSARSDNYARMIAVLSVAEWSYLSWATPHNPPSKTLPFYFSEWISLHAGEGFETVVDYLRTQLDNCWQAASSQEKQDATAAFIEAVALEKAFFDAAYGG